MPAARLQRRSPRSTITQYGSLESLPPHKAYMAVTLIELEKVRRKIERDTVQTRLDGLDGRLRAMESQKTALLRRLRRKGPAVPRMTARAGLTLNY